MRDTQGYDLEALDGSIGHVSDFVVDSQGWAIGYLVIDTGNWLPGRTVLISPHWVERIEWDDARLYLNVRKEVVANSPEQPTDLRFDRSFEHELHHHYGYPEYCKRDRQGCPHGDEFAAQESIIHLYLFSYPTLDLYPSTGARIHVKLRISPRRSR
jgi:hypothetical protein